MIDSKVTVICLIPTRNNASLLPRCLQSASLWADHIIVCDQMSTDSSREIALSFPKVKLIDNPSEEYNESVRQKLLINEARKIEGQRLFIALDADEIFTPNILYSSEWKTILNSKPGTIFKFQWANFGPNLSYMWLGYHFPWGYMDDGYEHEENKVIHSGRIPIPAGHDFITINQIKVIHFQFSNWNKMLVKHCYYQCLEKTLYPKKSSVDIFRTYHHMYAITDSQKDPIPNDWIKEYDRLGIDITSVYHETKDWFDVQVLKLIKKHGANKFKKLNIWSINWAEKAYLLGYKNTDFLQDPRSKFDKFIQNWLMKTQNKLHIRKYRRIDKLIKLILKY